MKRSFIILTCALTLFLLASCGGNDGGEVNSKEAEKTKAQTEAEATDEEDEYINVAGCWLQTTEGDSFMINFNDDNTMDYRAFLSNEESFFTEYLLEPDHLTIDMVNTNATTGTTPVVYKIELNEDQPSPILTLTLDRERSSDDLSSLYGWETVLEGSYRYLNLTADQVETVRKELGVPDDIDVTIAQRTPEYWDGGQRWLVDIEFYDGTTLIAAAAVDPQTTEPCRDIIRYTGN